MNTPCLSSKSTANPRILLRGHHVISGSCIVLRSTYIVNTSYGCLNSVRTIWGPGWPWRDRRSARSRVDLEERLDKMSRTLHGYYVNINHFKKRKLAYQRYWRGWNRSFLWDDPRRYSRSSRERYDWQNKTPPASDQQDELAKLTKKIEADPYEFLFGKSNEYLQLPKAWSSFCRSFLESDMTHQVRPKSCASEKLSAKTPTSDDRHFEKASSDSNATKPSTSIVHSQQSQFDPISGKMVPNNIQTADKSTGNGSEDTDIPVKIFTGFDSSLSKKPDLPAREHTGQSQPPDTRNNQSNVIYLDGPSRSSHEALKAPDWSLKTSVIDPKPQDSHEGDRDLVTNQEKERGHQFHGDKENDVSRLQASDRRVSVSSGEAIQEITDKIKVARDVLEQDYAFLENFAYDSSSGQTKEEVAAKKKLARDALERHYASYKDPADDINVKALRDVRHKRENHNPDNEIDMRKPVIDTPDSAQPHRPAYISRQIYHSESEETKGSHWKAENAKSVLTSVSKSPKTDNADASSRGLIEQQCDEALENARRFTESMKLFNQEIADLCERLESSAVDSREIYRVLAYDPSNSEIVIAETTSSLHAPEQIVPPSEVMLHLNNPAKFLPYFEKMKADGYEIVAGGGEILVFRRTRFDTPVASSSIQSDFAKTSDVQTSLREADRLENLEDIVHSTNRLEKTEKPIPGQSSANSTPRIVRRQETIYTGGPPNWSPYPPRSPFYDGNEDVTETIETELPKSSSVGKAIRRIFLTGFATAGTFYAIGVVCEYFRTGGQDGLGPEGFSEFEAERRRRD